MADSSDNPGRLLAYEGDSGHIRDDAFHGTTRERALKIMTEGFRPHLGIAGFGCYFDLGSDSSARAFALERAGGDRDGAVIIRAELHLGVVLDLSFRRNPEIKRQFQRFQSELREELGFPHGRTFNDEKERFLQQQ